LKITYFASGSNRAGEIRGLADLGHPIGIAVPEVMPSADATAELERLAGAGVAVFADSGAFSEVAFGPEGPRVVKPISDAEWIERLDFYERLARVLGSSLYVVAPDKVGYPDETLERLERYRDRIRALVALGVNVIVAIQGDDKAGFYERILELELGDVIPGLPCKKNATTDEQLADFIARARPRRLHLLGLGIKSRRAPALLEYLEGVAPGLELSLDSCLIASLAGKTNGPGGGPRAGTLALEQVNDEAIELAFGEGSEPGDMETVPDYTDIIGEPSAWITPTLARKFGRALGLSEAELEAFEADPDQWLQEGEPPRYAQPEIAFALDQVWLERHRKLTAKERKRRQTTLSITLIRKG
jgi:hypothetical protein